MFCFFHFLKQSVLWCVYRNTGVRYVFKKYLTKKPTRFFISKMRYIIIQFLKISYLKYMHIMSFVARMKHHYPLNRQKMAVLQKIPSIYEVFFLFWNCYFSFCHCLFAVACNEIWQYSRIYLNKQKILDSDYLPVLYLYFK